MCRTAVVFFGGANPDHDSSSSQKIHADMDELIHSRPVDGAREVKAELVVSQLERSREGRRNRRIFYVLNDGGGRSLTAGTCGTDERSMLERTLARTSRSKTTSLR